MKKRQVIVVTDGDSVAQQAVEVAATNIGGRCISISAGNPTILTGEEIVQMVMTAPKDPVVVMVDDQGEKGVGPGEEALGTIMRSPEVDILGVVAVSSNGKDCNGLDVSCSITQDGKVIDGAVNKAGKDIGEKDICGDTLSILRGKRGLVIVGIGDPGKMDYQDEVAKGAPITTKALQEVMKRSHFHASGAMEK